MFIGVISDTHGVFSDEFREFFAPVDEIWHAGDFGGGIDFVHTISAFKPLVGVCGNCDAQEIRLVKDVAGALKASLRSAAGLRERH